MPPQQRLPRDSGPTPPSAGCSSWRDSSRAETLIKKGSFGRPQLGMCRCIPVPYEHFDSGRLLSIFASGIRHLGVRTLHTRRQPQLDSGAFRRSHCSGRRPSVGLPNAKKFPLCIPHGPTPLPHPRSPILGCEARRVALRLLCPTQLLEAEAVQSSGDLAKV